MNMYRDKHRDEVLSDTRFKLFDAIYDTELVFRSNCFKLCGDAHCCNFSRYKSRFALISKRPSQELPLLPGEFKYLESKGYLSQFGDYERRRVPFMLSKAELVYDSIISYREGCACNHSTRTTICRLYPLFPKFNINGSLKGVEPAEQFGIYEALEEIGGLDRACKLTYLPFDQLEQFLKLTALIGSAPDFVFHMESYRIAKAMVFKKLKETSDKAPDQSVFRHLELMLLRGELFDPEPLRFELDALQAEYGYAGIGW